MVNWKEKLLEISRENIDNKSNIELLHIKGCLDNSTAIDFERFFLSYTSHVSYYFILDLSQVEKVTNNGLSVFIQLIERVLLKNGKLALLNIPKEVKMIFDFVGISDKISIFYTLLDALNYFESMDIPSPIQPMEYKIPEVEAQPISEKIPEAEKNSEASLMAKLYRESNPLSTSKRPKPPLRAETFQAMNKKEKIISTICPNCNLNLGKQKSNTFFLCPGCGHDFIIS